MGVEWGSVGVREYWGCHDFLHRENDFFQNLRGMNGVSRLLYDSVEPGVLVSGVVDGTDGAVGFNQLVVAFNFIAVSLLSLFFDVPSMIILYSVLEFILGRSLK
jgi:hypothetical protein